MTRAFFDARAFVRVPASAYESKFRSPVVVRARLLERTRKGKRERADICVRNKQTDRKAGRQAGRQTHRQTKGNRQLTEQYIICESP